MMLNSKISSSKKVQKKQGINSPRSPLKLKDLNVASSSLSLSLSSSCSSSTTASSISSEAPRGCLRLFLSHHCSANDKHGSCIKPKPKFGVVDQAAKSAPSFRGNVVKKRSNLQNQSKFISRKVQRNPPVPAKSGGRFSSRYDLSDGVNKFTSGFQLKLSDVDANLSKVRKPSSRYDVSDGLKRISSGFDLKLRGNAENVSEPGSRYDFSDGLGGCSSGSELKLSDHAGKFTPENDLGCGSGLDRLRRPDKAVNLGGNDANYADGSRSPTPLPVQSSVSPEIPGGLTSVVAATPTTCYAAGHVLSGVTDKRKCRPRGILTIEKNDLFGSGKTKGFCSEGESVVGDFNRRRDSIVPSPTEASVCWLSSPFDENKSRGEYDGAYDASNELRLQEKLVGYLSSPSSSLGLSSELLPKSTGTLSTTYANTATPKSGRSRNSALHSDLSSEFRSVLGPSFDHLVCSLSLPSPVASPPCKSSLSPEQGKFRFRHERDATSNLEDSVGSMNVMETPESNASSPKLGLSGLCETSNSKSPKFGLSDLSRDEISRLWFQSELDSVAEVLRRVSLSPGCQVPELDSPRSSFEFNPLIKLDDSADFTLFQKAMDTETPDISESLLHSLPEPEVRISWREGLASRIYEMDEFDCCRYLSDDEDNANGCSDTSLSCSSPQIAASGSNYNVEDTCDPNASLQHEESNSEKIGESLALEELKLCPDSLNDDGRYALVPEDSSWTVWPENNLFQV